MKLIKKEHKSIFMFVAYGFKGYTFARAKCMAKKNNAAYYILYFWTLPRIFTPKCSYC